MRKLRSALLWLAISLLIVLIVGMLLILVHPVLWTGRYYEFTVKQAKLEDDGTLTIVYDDVLTYGTEVTWRWRPAMAKAETISYSWDQRAPGFLRWPRRSRDQVLGLRWVPGERLLLQEGTYRIRSGKWMDFIETTLPDGRTLPSEISVDPKR